jgi:hypothetical protein
MPNSASLLHTMAMLNTFVAGRFESVRRFPAEQAGKELTNSTNSESGWVYTGSLILRRKVQMGSDICRLPRSAVVSVRTYGRKWHSCGICIPAAHQSISGYAITSVPGALIGRHD